MSHAPPFQRPEPPDLREHGAPVDGKPQAMDRRLFVQLQVFTGCHDHKPLAAALAASGLDAALYLDANDPYGVGVVVCAGDPAVFATTARDVYNGPAFGELMHRPEYTMIGRTYSQGREANLEYWLIKRPRNNILNPAAAWAVWYPLRRKGEFSLLSPEEQRSHLMEHAGIGYNYGEADLAHDVRLACHGIDPNDNDFVIGLLGKELHPLSRCVQDMRKTQQTGRFMQQMGPFFVGRAVWQAPKDR